MTTEKFAERQAHKRKRTLVGITIVFLVAVAAYILYALLVLSNYESTENAYVGGNLVMISSQEAGTVTAINADDTQRVEAGSPVIELDPTDAEVALQKARAQLGAVVSDLSQRYAALGQYQAVVRQRKVALASAKSDLARRAPLAASRTVSEETVTHAQQAVKEAQAALDVAQHQLEAAQAGLAGVDIEHHPQVLAAKQAYIQAWIQRQRTEIVAPVTGYVAKRSVQVGSRVTAGTPLMSIVPLDHVWVDANFKESDLANIRIGQPVSLESDMYGGDVAYHGKVLGLAAGTGSAFSVLPAQNATGNWIKVVQRLPVRIQLDPEELKKHPLRVGLSMHVEVDTHDRSGAVLADQKPVKAVYSSQAYDLPVAKAAEQADEIIRTNRKNG